MPDYQIHPLDLQFLGAPQAIASFLILGPGGPILIETGPGSTRPTLERELGRFGITPAQVRDVLVTHIHLDHAGAAGWWARQGATVHVHHVGAPHLIDPERLLASARRIYGDDMDRLWGEFLSAPAERVHALHDGDVVEAGGLRFQAHDTPGHARHHLVYQLDDVAFTGDLAGVRRPGHAHLRLPTPPPEFDLEAWQASAERMRAQRFRCLYLTHFGPVADADSHWARVLSLLPEFAGRVHTGLEAGLDREAIVAGMERWEQSRLEAEAVPASEWPIYANIGPSGMSVDGVLRYWKKREGG